MRDWTTGMSLVLKEKMIGSPIPGGRVGRTWSIFSLTSMRTMSRFCPHLNWSWNSTLSAVEVDPRRFTPGVVARASSSGLVICFSICVGFEFGYGMLMPMNGMSTFGRNASGRRFMAMPPTTMMLSRIIRVVTGRRIDRAGRFMRGSLLTFERASEDRLRQVAGPERRRRRPAPGGSGRALRAAGGGLRRAGAGEGDPIEEGVDHRDDDQGQEGRDAQAADDGDGQGGAQLGTLAQTHGHRPQPQGGRRGRHQDPAHAPQARLHQRG